MTKDSTSCVARLKDHLYEAIGLEESGTKIDLLKKALSDNSEKLPIGGDLSVLPFLELLA